MNGKRDFDALTLTSVRRTFVVPGRQPFAAPRALQAVADVTLRIPMGTIFGLVGESGCGKSTLAKLILGLDRVSAGTVSVFGRPIEGIDRLTLARLVQPVFQDPNASLNPSHTVGEIIGTPLSVHGIDVRSARRRRVEEMMARVGLAPSLYGGYPAQLSGGQRQRVAIARALILEPRVLICDEPTSALDVSVQAQILNLMSDLHRRLGLTIVLISHNLSVVRHLAGQMAVMYFGRIVEQGPTREIFAAPRHPYTRALLDSDPNLRTDQGLGVAQAEGELPDPLSPPPACAFAPRCTFASERCCTARPFLAAHGAVSVACHFPLPAAGAVAAISSTSISTSSSLERSGSSCELA